MSSERRTCSRCSGAGYVCIVGVLGKQSRTCPKCGESGEEAGS